LGSGCLGHLEFRLACERWQVGTAVPDGGVGGLLGVAGHFNVKAATPNLLRAPASCRADDEVAPDIVRWRPFGASPHVGGMTPGRVKRLESDKVYG
jgi:hypothetical protein